MRIFSHSLHFSCICPAMLCLSGYRGVMARASEEHHQVTECIAAVARMGAKKRVPFGPQNLCCAETASCYFGAWNRIL